MNYNERHMIKVFDTELSQILRSKGFSYIVEKVGDTDTHVFIAQDELLEYLRTLVVEGQFSKDASLYFNEINKSEEACLWTNTYL